MKDKVQLNKYDLVEFLALKLRGAPCTICPISKECNKREDYDFICSNKDEARKTLIKKYNL